MPPDARGSAAWAAIPMPPPREFDDGSGGGRDFCLGWGGSVALGPPGVPPPDVAPPFAPPPPREEALAVLNARAACDPLRTGFSHVVPVAGFRPTLPKLRSARCSIAASPNDVGRDGMPMYCAWSAAAVWAWFAAATFAAAEDMCMPPPPPREDRRSIIASSTLAWISRSVFAAWSCHLASRSATRCSSVDTVDRNVSISRC
mmetsp:Transcript_39901/g.96035  ORF Transcript_39901/g.96035 Transcript_39901/m.96035 type:complete len:202 (-) Transcript_39901:638-1243(-)